VAGGVYLEEAGTLFTHQAVDSGAMFTLERAIDHEQSHYLQGRYVFPGSWTDGGYHDEPKGWADEGIAEFLVEGGFSREGERFLPSERLTRVCESPKPDLSSLLSRREGYSEPGSFDYDNSWIFVHYLMTQQPAAAANLFRSLRHGTYRLKELCGDIRRGIRGRNRKRLAWRDRGELVREPAARSMSRLRRDFQAGRRAENGPPA
jgi:hypothetical protein